MLYDMEFKDYKGEKPAQALFYRAQMVCGAIDVPSKDSEEILR